jgi:hypothetical protein
MKEPIMASNNRKSVVLTVAADGRVTDITFNATKALESFRTVKPGSWEPGNAGERYTLGLAYFLGNKADREALANDYGKGRIRRGLMVASRATKDEAIAKSITVLAESLRTITVKKVAKAAKGKATKSVTKKAATRKVATKVAA